MNIIELSDEKPKPDSTFPYLSKIRDTGIPLVIDNGKQYK